MLRNLVIAAVVATAVDAALRGAAFRLSAGAGIFDPATRALSDACPATCDGYTCDHQAAFLDSTCAALEADLGCDCAGCGCGCAYDEVHHQGECLPLCAVGLGYAADGSACGECLPGQYWKSGVCTVCSTGYTDAPGATSCSACPDYTATLPSGLTQDHDSEDDCRQLVSCSPWVTLNARGADDLDARWHWTDPSGNDIASGVIADPSGNDIEDLQMYVPARRLPPPVRVATDPSLQPASRSSAGYLLLPRGRQLFPPSRDRLANTQRLGFRASRRWQLHAHLCGRRAHMPRRRSVDPSGRVRCCRT